MSAPTDFFADPEPVTVQLSEIVSYQEIDLSQAKEHLAALHAGKKIKPVEVDSEWTEHWKDTATGSEYLGMGYALIEGHDRYSALVATLGLGARVDVVMQGLRPIRGWKMGRP
jgi:hypothetical protein